MRSLGQFYFFFFFSFTKRFYTNNKYKNAHKGTKSKKAAFFMRLKNIQGEKSRLFAYLRFCTFWCFFVLFSSNINEVIQGNFKLLYLKFSQAQKAQNAYKRTKIKNAPKNI